MGSNYIRISHYPQDDALLDACDELGLLAWEEILIIDLVPDTPGYADNCERNLREMIRQHFNHPSIINWGYMNEILLCTPWPGTKEWPAFKERTLALAERLEKVLKEEDATRKSVMADVTKPATQLPNLLARSNGEASSKDARFDVSINGEIKETDFTPTDGRHNRTAFKPKSMPTLRLVFSKSSTSTCALDRIRRSRAQVFICIFVN